MSKNSRLGETNVNNQGLRMEIISYRKYKDIDVKFDDGYIAYNRTYQQFQRGAILNVKFNRPLTNNRNNEESLNNQGLKMRIIRYGNKKDIDVEFEDGYIAYNKAYSSFKRGEISSKYFKSVCGVGFIGDVGVVKGYKKLKSYTIWCAMIRRCYNEKFKSAHPTYKNCSVCDEWHNYSNFKKWYDDNYYGINEEVMCLDKDIISKNNKIYSPDTCVFVPNKINILFTKTNKKRGNLPIGVTYNKNNNNYNAYLSKYGNRVHIGNFNSPEEAFCAYKKAKEEYIREVADEYKGKIPSKLYEAMYRWEVEIDD